MTDDQERRGLFRRRQRPDDPPHLRGGDAEDDFPALDHLPDTDQEALDSLADLSPEDVRPLNITPVEERFPPVAPPVDDQATRVNPAVSDREPPVDPVLLEQRRIARKYNRLSLVMLILSALAVLVFVTIWQDPFTVLNPFPPDVLYVQVTATPGAEMIIATEAPVTPAPADDFPFVLAGDRVRYTANPNDRGCEWQSIGGVVTDSAGDGVNGYRVRISGESLDETVFTGAAPSFGDGGYELPLGNVPLVRTYTVQLLTPQGDAVSAPVTVETRDECDGNVALVNFTGS